MIVKDFTVVTGYSEEFCDGVKEKLERGWKLYGNMTATNGVLHQAMVLEEYEVYDNPSTSTTSTSTSTTSTTTRKPIRPIVNPLIAVSTLSDALSDNISALSAMDNSCIRVQGEGIGYLSMSPISVHDPIRTRQITKSPDRHDI